MVFGGPLPNRGHMLSLSEERVGAKKGVGSRKAESAPDPLDSPDPWIPLRQLKILVRPPYSRPSLEGSRCSMSLRQVPIPGTKLALPVINFPI